MDGDIAATLVLDVPEIAKAVHEEVDPSACRPDHRGQYFLRHWPDLVGLRSILSPVPREKQQGPCKPPFNVVEELICEVSLDPQVPPQDVGQKAFGKGG